MGSDWITRFLIANDKAMTFLTRDCRFGHVMWGFGCGAAMWSGKILLSVVLLATGAVGMIHGAIKDREAELRGE